MEDVSDEGDWPSASTSTQRVKPKVQFFQSQSCSFSNVHQESKRRNPAYYFYEEVNRNAKGEPGNKGNKHFKCLHGNCKVLTITQSMCYSLNGRSNNSLHNILIAHLSVRSCSTSSHLLPCHVQALRESQRS